MFINSIFFIWGKGEKSQMLQIAICEDNQHFLNQLICSIETILEKNKIAGSIVYSTTNASDLDQHISESKANTFFLDIDLGNSTNGYMLAEKIRKHDIHAYIVFITCHYEFVFQAFKVNSFDFLIKPLSDEILEQCLLRIYENYMISKNIQDFIDVKSGSIIYKLKKNDIVYIESLNRNTFIHMKNGQITCHESLDRLEKQLGNGSFIRCHKSFIANKIFISEIHQKDKLIVFRTGHQCYLGRKYKKNLIV